MIRYLEQKDIPQRYKVSALDNGVPASSLLAYQYSNIVTIEHIQVYGEFRRRGIATQMIALLEVWAKENNSTKILGPLPICDADSVSDIAGSYKLFESLGYTHPLGFLICKNLTSQAK